MRTTVQDEKQESWEEEEVELQVELEDEAE